MEQEIRANLAKLASSSTPTMRCRLSSGLPSTLSPVVERFLDGMPRRLDVATEDVRLSAALIEIEASTANAAKIELVTVRQ